jgi:hypothetical protein
MSKNLKTNFSLAIRRGKIIMEQYSKKLQESERLAGKGNHILKLENKNNLKIQIEITKNYVPKNINQKDRMSYWLIIKKAKIKKFEFDSLI